MGKIRLKMKVRAQRKFAQGAIMPPQHSQARARASAPGPGLIPIIRPPSTPCKPIVKHNFNVTTLLNVISLRGVHEPYHPLPFFGQESPPAIENVLPERPPSAKKKKFKLKDKCVKLAVKKQQTSVQRSRRTSSASGASVSDSAEENQPLAYYQAASGENATPPTTSRRIDAADQVTPPVTPGSRDSRAPLVMLHSKIPSITENQIGVDASLPSTSTPTCGEAQIPEVDVLKGNQATRSRGKRSPRTSLEQRQAVAERKLEESTSGSTSKLAPLALPQSVSGGARDSRYIAMKKQPLKQRTKFTTREKVKSIPDPASITVGLNAPRSSTARDFKRPQVPARLLRRVGNARRLLTPPTSLPNKEEETPRQISQTRKRLRSSGRTPAPLPDRRKVTPKRNKSTLRPANLTEDVPEKRSATLRPVVCLTPLELPPEATETPPTSPLKARKPKENHCDKTEALEPKYSTVTQHAKESSSIQIPRAVCSQVTPQVLLENIKSCHTVKDHGNAPKTPENGTPTDTPQAKVTDLTPTPRVAIEKLQAVTKRHDSAPVEKNIGRTPQATIRNNVRASQTSTENRCFGLRASVDKNVNVCSQVERDLVLKPPLAADNKLTSVSGTSENNQVSNPKIAATDHTQKFTKDINLTPFPHVVLEKKVLTHQIATNLIPAHTKDNNTTSFPHVVLDKNSVLTSQINTIPAQAAKEKKITPMPQVVLQKNDLTHTKKKSVKAITTAPVLQTMENLTALPHEVAGKKPALTRRLMEKNIKPMPEPAAKLKKVVSRLETNSCNKSKVKPKSGLMPVAQPIGKVLEAPIYRPTEEEFKDPIGYIEKIESEAAKFGICKIVPPASFRIPYHLDQTVMFKTSNQYVGRLYQRWGATARVMATIQVLMALTEKSDKTKQPPNLDGIEVDLVKLYRLVSERGGIQELMGDRAQWARLARDMARPAADGRKLEKIYIKNVLPYESLSHADRMKIHSQVDAVWSVRLRRGVRRASRPLHYQRRLLGDTSSSDEDETPTDGAGVARLGKHVLDRAEECVNHAGRNNLDTFRKRAGELQQMRFPNRSGSIPADDVEQQYWRLVCLCQEHVVVQTAAIDTSVGRLGHEADPAALGGRHPWNLKRIAESERNVLRSLGAALSVTVPTLSLNQLFSTNCWHMDPHRLAWMDVMHEGSPKIWYAVGACDAGRFRRAMEALAPAAVQHKGLWLPSDTAMVPPALLSLHAVPLSRVLQHPHEYIVVFPGAYFSSVATGLSISESIYFGSLTWLHHMDRIFDEMVSDCEPSMFSRTALVLRIAESVSVSARVARLVLPSLRALVAAEQALRQRARALDLKMLKDKSGAQSASATSWPNQPECSLCRVPLILSKTSRTDDRSLVCLTHGLRLLEQAGGAAGAGAPPVTLFYSDKRLAAILKSLEARVDHALEEEEELDCNDGAVACL